jgi:hypothetical protein
VGGLTSFATTFFTQRYQARRDLLAKDAANREELYSQFIKETANLYMDSLGRTLENPASLIEMYSLVGRIRLISTDKVLLAAETIADSIVVSCSRPPATFDDVYKLAREVTLIRSKSSPRRAEKSERSCSSVFSGGDTFEHDRP